MADVRFEGDPAAQFAKLARDLRKAGAADLRRELYRGLNVSARPLIEAAKASAASELPSSGGRGVRSFNRKTGAKQNKLKTKGFAHRDGANTRVESLASRVANARFSVKGKAGRNPYVVLQATEAGGRKINLKRLDGGIVRHPVFGNREVWKDQAVTPRWWSKPMEAGQAAVAAEVVASVNRVSALFYAGN